MNAVRTPVTSLISNSAWPNHFDSDCGGAPDACGSNTLPRTLADVTDFRLTKFLHGCRRGVSSARRLRPLRRRRKVHPNSPWSPAQARTSQHNHPLLKTWLQSSQAKLITNSAEETGFHHDTASGSRLGQLHGGWGGLSHASAPAGGKCPGALHVAV